MLAFRTYLRKNNKVAEQYVKIKKQALKKAKGNGEIYRKQKDTFLKKVITEALKKR